jgi:hypothetical protein
MSVFGEKVPSENLSPWRRTAGPFRDPDRHCVAVVCKEKTIRWPSAQDPHEILIRSHFVI